VLANTTKLADGIGAGHVERLSGATKVTRLGAVNGKGDIPDVLRVTAIKNLPTWIISDISSRLDA